MMITISRRERYRAYPTAAQKSFMRQQFGARRWLWNRYVTEGEEQGKAGETIEPSSYTAFFDEAPWLVECDSCNLDLTKQDYRQAWSNYWKNPQSGKPKKKKKHKSKLSYSTSNNPKRKKDGSLSQTIWQKGDAVKLPGMSDPVKIKRHRPLPAGHRIKRATVIEEMRDVFYISISYDIEVEVPDELIVSRDEMIGLDYSSPDFYVDEHGDNPGTHRHWFRETEDKLAKAQQKRNRREFRSKSWFRAKNKAAKASGYAKHARKDFTEKLSANFAGTFKIVFVEDIDLRNMAGSLKLGKSTNDNGFGMFRSQLETKLGIQGGALVKVPRFFPSSKLCSCCGYKYSSLSLSEREWDCPHCHIHHKRDENAGNNIHEMGLFGLVYEKHITAVVLDTGEVVSLKRRKRTRELSLSLACGESPWGTVVAYVFDSSCTRKIIGKATSFVAVKLADESAREYVEAKRGKWNGSR